MCCNGVVQYKKSGQLLSKVGYHYAMKNSIISQPQLVFPCQVLGRNSLSLVFFFMPSSSSQIYLRISKNLPSHMVVICRWLSSFRILFGICFPFQRPLMYRIELHILSDCITDSVKPVMELLLVMEN